MMTEFDDLLLGGDLRSIGKANEVVGRVKHQEEFDILFDAMLGQDRLKAMRAADAVEKITLRRPEFLLSHKTDLLNLCRQATHIELKWHLALLVSRIPLSEAETGEIWALLSQWATDKKESRIVRVNSLQTLFDLLQNHPELKQDFLWMVSGLERENIPSLNARLRKIRKSKGFPKG